MNRSRRGGTAVMIAASAALLVLASAGPAAAATDQVLVSLDGTHWATSLDQDVFRQVLVPGSTATTVLQVKNDSSVPATLALTARDAAAGTPAFLPMLSLGAALPASSVTVPLDSAEQCAVLVDDVPVLQPGETLPVTLSLAMGDAQGDQAKNDSATFDLVIALTEVVGGTSAPAACSIEAPADGSSADASGSAPASPASSEPESSSSSVKKGGRGATASDASAVIAENDNDGTASATGSAPGDTQVDTLALHDETANPNTYSFGMAGVAILVGAGVSGWFLLAGRRRREREDTQA